MGWIVPPDRDGRGLHAVVPSLLGSMSIPGFTDTLGLPACRKAAVLLIDGLGWNALREHAADAPFLTALASRQPLTAGFPTTTATSLTSLGTGRPPGEHGIVGYTFGEPSVGLLYPLSWEIRTESHERRSVLKDLPPEQFQRNPTVWERAAEAGVRTCIAVPTEFRGSGLTRAALRGAEFRGVRAFGDLGAELLAVLSGPGPALCYGYHGHLDLLGHVHGPGSLPWRLQLTQIDRLIAQLAERLPGGASLAVVADHGMVEVEPGTALDADAHPELLSGVRLIGGEARARHVYARDGAVEDILATWQEALGQRGLVLTGEDAIARGWFGASVSDSVRARIGDVLAVVQRSGVIRSTVEPSESALRGQHGSLTADEQLVPLLVVKG